MNQRHFKSFDKAHETSIVAGTSLMLRQRFSTGLPSTNPHYMADGRRVAEDTGTLPGGTLVTRYFANDYQNSIGFVTDDTYNGTNPVETVGYDAFGKPRNVNGTADPTFGASNPEVRGYINQEMLPEVQLIDLNARYFDPFLAKFLAPDPVVGNMDDSQAWNPYAYGHNDPMSTDDPTGLWYVEGKNPSSSASGFGGGPQFSGTLGDDDTDDDTEYVTVTVTITVTTKSVQNQANKSGSGQATTGGRAATGAESVTEAHYSYNLGGEHYEGELGSFGHGGAPMGGGQLAGSNAASGQSARSPMAEVIDNFIDGFRDARLNARSPMAGKGYGTIFDQAGKLYNADPRIMAALAAEETALGLRTGWGKNNLFNNGGSVATPRDFPSLEDAIRREARLFTRSPYNNPNSVAEMYHNYCSGSCSTGLKNIATFLGEMGGNMNSFKYPQ